MPKVHMAESRDLKSDGRVETELVTSLEASRSPVRPVLYLDVGVFFQGKPDGRTIPLGLTPPAAHQLSELLRAAVEQYLQSAPDKPFALSDYVV